MNAPEREPPVYRPFALLAFGATILVGTPLGVRLLAWLYAGAPAVAVDTVLLHAHLQLIGFFGTLIPGVAHHLIARFTGRRTRAHAVTPWLAGLLGLGIALRVVGTWQALPEAILAASLVESVAFTAFGVWVWRSLEPPPLATVRWHLSVATGWLAAASLVEIAVRVAALAEGATTPDVAMMRAAHAMATYGGVTGWVLGVLLRAGPMFVPAWSVPAPLAHAVPWLLALGVAASIAGDVGGAPVLARLGDVAALAAVTAVAAAAGAFRAAPRALPMASRSAPEARIFRLAVVSTVTALAGAMLAALLAASGVETHVITDAVRHLVTVGFLAAVVVAMAFRLIPTLEASPLPWPRLRTVAFWALIGAVVLRTTEVVVGVGWVWLALAVALSGVLAWVALATVGATLVTTIYRASKRSAA